MALVTNLKRINKDDFSADDAELVEKLAFSLNPFLEQVTQAFNKSIDFDNLNQQYMTFTVEVDSSGVPKTNLELKISLKTRIKGCSVIAADNLSDTTLLTGAPFVSYNLIPGGISIKQITGIPANKSFRISVVLIG